MNDFMMELEGQDGIFAVFHQDEGAGYFFAYRPDLKEVIAQTCIYEKGMDCSLREDDIRLLWSRERTKCGIVVFGTLRSIINIDTKEEICSPLPSEEGIVDQEWLEGFEDQYLNKREFIKARKRYWMEMANSKRNRD